MRDSLKNLKKQLSIIDSSWDGMSSEIFKDIFTDDVQSLDIIIKNLDAIYKYEEYARLKYERCEQKVSMIVASGEGGGR